VLDGVADDEGLQHLGDRGRVRAGREASLLQRAVADLREVLPRRSCGGGSPAGRGRRDGAGDPEVSTVEEIVASLED